MMSDSTRRDFLHRAALTTAALATTQLRTANAFAANEQLQIGCIGTGGRCQALMKGLAKVPGTKITALCDVYDRRIESAKKLATPDPFVTRDFRELLARPDVDAVIIATPDHWHVPIAVAACEAGKDVYVEKPLTHSLSEGALITAAQAKSKRVVQVGTMQRSMTHFQKGFEIIQSGVLGEIHRVHLTWNRNQARQSVNKNDVNPATVDWQQFLGNAPQQPFDPYRMLNWRWFWDFGGGIFTDLLVHHIDIVNWYLHLQTPDSATSIGDHVQTAGLWQTPDTVQTLLHYDKPKLQVHFEGTFVNARNGEMLEFMGSEGTLYLDRGRYEIIPEKGKMLEPSEMVLGSGPRGADYYDHPPGDVLHLANWADCIRTRQEPNSPVASGVAAAATAHLANQALRSGQIVHGPENAG
jgi:predicted dehydrogenase